MLYSSSLMKKAVRMEKKRACLKYLAANIGNIGVVGVGLAIFQNASVWAFLGGGLLIYMGLYLIRKAYQ